MAEGGSGGRNVGRVFGFVEWALRLSFVFLGNDVVDRFLHAAALLHESIILFD